MEKYFVAITYHEIWRQIFNFEIYHRSDIVRFVKVQRLKWAGHITSRPDNNHAKRPTMSNLEGKGYRGHPRTRWLDDVEVDLKIVGRRGPKMEINRKEPKGMATNLCLCNL